MGPAGARRLMDELGVRGSDAGDTDASLTPLVKLVDHPIAVPKGAADGVRELRSALAGCLDEELLPPAAQLERLRAYLGPVIDRKYQAPAPRMADLEQLALLAQGYESRGRFLAELTLDPPSSTSDLAGPPLLDEDFLILSTIHSAKGLEWDVVHVIHAADGHIPSDMATGDDEELEEERRLLYVALTRARDDLRVTFPQRYHYRPKGRDDRHGYAALSRFLEPADVRTCFDERGPDVDLTDAAPAVTGVATVDDYLADLFG